jgi:hypothetical protein
MSANGSKPVSLQTPSAIKADNQNFQNRKIRKSESRKKSKCKVKNFRIKIRERLLLIMRSLAYEGRASQRSRDRDDSYRHRRDSDVTVGVGPGGITVGPRRNCRMVTTTIDRGDGRMITRKERRCD